MGELEQVPLERIRKIIDVLSLVAVGKFDHADIDIANEDEFAMLEQTLNLFVAELKDSRERNHRYVEELKQSHAELEARLETIDLQRRAIDKLTIPVLEVGDGMLVLPIIGSVDRTRAEELTTRLLEKLLTLSGKLVIIDVSGAELLDSQTAAHLLHMIKSARLMGCNCALSGISPELARTAVQSGVDLAGTPTFRGLKEAIRARLAGNESGGTR